jgi:hypothetical protein
MYLEFIPTASERVGINSDLQMNLRRDLRSGILFGNVISTRAVLESKREGFGPIFRPFRARTNALA